MKDKTALAQPAAEKALNLVVVGSNPTWVQSAMNRFAAILLIDRAKIMLTRISANLGWEILPHSWAKSIHMGWISARCGQVSDTPLSQTLSKSNFMPSRLKDEIRESSPSRADISGAVLALVCRVWFSLASGVCTEISTIRSSQLSRYYYLLVTLWDFRIAGCRRCRPTITCGG